MKKTSQISKNPAESFKRVKGSHSLTVGIMGWWRNVLNCTCLRWSWDNSHPEVMTGSPPVTPPSEDAVKPCTDEAARATTRRTKETIRFIVKKLSCFVLIDFSKSWLNVFSVVGSHGPLQLCVIIAITSWVDATSLIDLTNSAEKTQVFYGEQVQKLPRMVDDALKPMQV